jgi:hypothetical protein
VSGVSLIPDGDLLGAGGGPSHTELAIRAIGSRLGLSEAQIGNDLESARDAAFEQTDLYRRVFDLAAKSTHGAPARAAIPQIQLAGPKLSRHLTTEWYARRVDGRYQQCKRSAE